MLTADNDLLEKILSNNIDKQEAIQIFESLPEAEKKQLMSKLKFKLSGNDNTGENNLTAKNRLKAVDQRDLNDRHKDFIKRLTQDYDNFVPKSKKNVIKHHSYFVDQRRAFHLIKGLKAMHFQITYVGAEGPYVYDLDGNKYIDISGDMGVNIFGHRPPFIVNAVKEALDRGIPLSGYSEMIFEATKLFSELTGHERVLFTQSGTEAVMVAVRLARAATQKKKIVLFDGAFHGLSDAVVAMKGQDGKSLAAGPGMVQEFADQIIILDYGDMRSLDIIEDRCDEIAGVLVEPVQSRHIYNRPIEFLRELRKLTIEKGLPLIFDEMITGFRICPRGVQGYFNIKPDLATYGKIPGGGLPTGVIAGSAKYMDLIDGGIWNFDDDSMPKSTRAGMGGTHSQNPLKIASAHATLSEMKKRSPNPLNCDSGKSCNSCTCFQMELNKKTESMVKELNAFFIENSLPIIIDYFGSLFRFRFIDSFWGLTEALFFILLRMDGIETNIQGNAFLTTAHSDEDIRKVINSVKKCLKTLIQEGFFYEAEVNETESQEEHIQEFAKTTRVKNQAKAVGKIDNMQIEQLKSLILRDLKKFQE
ncbi:MAG: aminotransferase class III-fold pyridoxal phosphate-dependent enzyme [Bacteroidales bacterium]|nr:aminotransferase class III-fold pyridoxal phosphate-dependent enzyme [Bacteroidales bacterium]